MSVVPFRKREPIDPHVSGEALCIGCRHEWVQVAPVGLWLFDCPSCGAAKGIYRYPVGSVEGDNVLTCKCGCEALTAYGRGGRIWLRCMSCGADQTETYFGHG